MQQDTLLAEILVYYQIANLVNTETIAVLVQLVVQDIIVQKAQQVRLFVLQINGQQQVQPLVQHVLLAYHQQVQQVRIVAKHVLKSMELVVQHVIHQHV